jgi:protocatechuate 3,4-dioxygenase beta subunit
VSLTQKLIAILTLLTAGLVGSWILLSAGRDAGDLRGNEGVQQDAADFGLASQPAVQESVPEPRRELAVAKAPEERLPDTLHPDRRLDLHGIVIDPTGAGVPGATLAVLRNETREFSCLDLDYNREARRVAETVSDRAGRFAVRVPRGRPFEVHATCAGFAPEIVRDCFAGEYVVVQLHLGATLEGNVHLSGTDDPVPHAALRVWRRTDQIELFRGVADAQGSFRFEGLMPGPIYIETETEVGSAEWMLADLSDGEVTNLSIPVKRGVTVSGVVRDASTMEPVAGAEVGAGWTFDRPVRTDAAGRYVFRGYVREGVYEFHARAQGYGSGVLRAPSVVQGDLVDFDFLLESGLRAVGLVVDDDGIPVPDVYVAGVAYRRSGHDWQAARTAADGSFELRDLRQDMSHVLFVRKDGYATIVYDFPPPNEPSRVVDLGRLVLPQPSMIEGTVVDETGGGIASVVVTLRGANDDRYRLAGGLSNGSELADMYIARRKVHTDDLGRFCFDALAAGTYSLSVTEQMSKTSESVRVGENEVVDNLRLLVPTGRVLSGVVVDPEGNPVSSASIRLRAESSGTYAYARSESDGSFRFTGLEDQTYTLTTERHHWGLPEGTPHLGVARLEGVRPVQDQISIVLPRALATSGRVYGPDGGPGRGAYVTATGTDDTMLASGFCDAEGAYTLWVGEGETVDLAAVPSREEKSSSWGFTPEQDSAFEARADGIPAGTWGVVLQMVERPR